MMAEHSEDEGRDSLFTVLREAGMNITQKKSDGHVLVHMEGRFDFGARKTFKDAMDQAIKDEMPIVLDLEQVSFVDSSALGLLVISHQNLKSKKIPLCLNYSWWKGTLLVVQPSKVGIVRRKLYCH